MRIFLQVFSVQNLVASLVSISALTTVYAAPLDLNYYSSLGRRGTITIGGITAVQGEQLSSAGHQKSKVFRLTKWGDKVNPGYVVKVYDKIEVPSRETLALRELGQFIASEGKYLVMKEVRGTSLSALMGKKPSEERSEFLASWKPKVAQEMAEIARTKGILHNDPNMNNILIDGGKVHLIDWELWIGKTEPAFTDNVKKIQSTLDVVLDSQATPSGDKKTQSSGQKSQSSKPPGAKGSPVQARSPTTGDKEMPGQKTKSPKPPSAKRSPSKALSPKTSQASWQVATKCKGKSMIVKGSGDGGSVIMEDNR